MTTSHAAPAIDVSAKRLVFLVGAPRSGTTWLQLMLASSDQVATANETHVFSQYLVSAFETWDRLKGNVRDIGLTHLMDEREFLALIRDFVDGVIARMVASKPDATVVLEKTPEHVRYWRDMLKVYPDAYFLHLVRDPRAVVASMRAASQSWGYQWASSGLLDNCSKWRLLVEEGRQIKDATDNVIEVRYEDLKSDCAPELRRIFGWMGIDRSIEVCARIAECHRIDHLRSGTVEGVPWDLSREPEAFYRRGESDGWKHELPHTDVYLIEALTRDLMKTYGYAPLERPTSQMMVAGRLILGMERARPVLRSRVKRLAAALFPRA